ncbi:MAG: 6,7-dimethyl-8-ribityllumazine synthase [Terriglobales bacterium]
MAAKGQPQKRDARPSRRAGSAARARGPARTIKAGFSAAGFGFAIVVSRFNAFITDRLLASALDALERLGAARHRIRVVEVPGAFEIPATARALAKSRRYDGVICLGCILHGDTRHFEFISREVTRGVGESAQATGVPHAFGVLTCETLEQAVQRAGVKGGNKGWEAALVAVEMANLFKRLRSES